MSVADRVHAYTDDIGARDVLASIAFAVLPALGVYFVVSYAADDVLGWLFWLGIAGFTVPLVQKDGWRARTGASLFYLAVEAFLFPVAALIVAIRIVSEATATFGQLGAGFAGGAFFIMTWLVSWSVGVVLYYVAGRFESG